MLFPESARFDKRIPKQKFYNNLDITPALKRAFVEQIQSVYWSYKLAPEIISIGAGTEVAEIEVFEIKLTTKELDEAVLRQIDKQIPYHILFVLTYADQIRLAIAHKNAADSGKNAFKVNKYFYTPWQSEADLSISIKGLTMDTVWEGFITQISGITVQQGNTLDQQIVADEKRAKLEKEIARPEKLARAEKQPKKKFELVQQIQKLKESGHI